MREFEISIKSAPGGANVVVKGDLKQIIVEFARLSAKTQACRSACLLRP